MSYRVGNIAGLAAVILWSAVPLLVTFCAGMPFFLFLGLSCFGTVLPFAVKWWARGESVFESMRITADALAVSIIGNGVFRGLFWAAILLVNPIEATLINLVWPTMIVVFGVMLSGERIRSRHWLGFMAGLAGVVFLVSDGTDLFAKFALGHGLGIASGLIWGAYVAMAQRDDRYGGNAVPVAFLVSGVSFLVISALVERPWVFSWEDFGLVLVVSLAGGVGNYLWEIGAEKGEARVLGLCGLLMPVLATFWLAGLGNVTLDANGIAGAALIFGAAVVVSPFVRRRNIIKIEEIE